MTSIVLKSQVTGPLTYTELDTNFVNLNTDKLEAQGGTIQGYTETLHALGNTDTPTLDIQNGNVQSVTSDALTVTDWASAPAQSLTLIVTGTGTITDTTNYVWVNGDKDYAGTSIVNILWDGTQYLGSVVKGFS